VPLVRIDITGPKEPEYKRALLAGVRGAITNAFGVDDSRVVLRVVETPADDVDVPPCRSERLCVIDILMYEGRTPEMKAMMAAEARRALALDPGVEPSDVMISFRESSRLDLDVPPGEAP
jgi:phenylpyruvate tautomerase PptA (4-oxalocrotonate tautomerase family)